MVTRRLSASLGGLLVIGAMVACGGGGVNTTPIASPTASSQSVTTSTTTSTTIPTAYVAGISASTTLPPTNVIAAITESLSTSSFSGTPALSLARSVVSAARTPQVLTQTAILYVEFVTSTSVTLDGSPGISITLPSITAGATYYLAEYSATAGWQAPVAGPGTISGTTVSFASNTNATLQLSPTVPLEIALYSVTGTATPSPSPSPSPTPVASPAVLTFDAGTPTSAPFTVSETGDTAAFTAGINCTVAPSPSPHPTSTASPLPTPTPTPTGSGFVATLGATSATPSNGVATFTVNSGSAPGTCTVTVTDTRSATATVTVNVDSASIGIFSSHRSTR
jgi:hypothetical protein